MSSHHPLPGATPLAGEAGRPERYLEAELLDVHHGPQPGQGGVDEGQHRQEGDQVGCDVGNDLHRHGSPAAGGFQEVLSISVVGIESHLTGLSPKQQNPSSYRVREEAWMMYFRAKRPCLPSDTQRGEGAGQDPDFEPRAVQDRSC